ncbi:MAG TPA: alpha/beta hydrolase [Pirellulales bacterium]|jgi:pimeloyl-ACP methyl ester carboxylesterase|nr:alpha/beta hydrolase [Pirellulales bacterium]
MIYADSSRRIARNRLLVAWIAAIVIVSSVSPAPADGFAGEKSSYHGFDRYDFIVDGCRAIVVRPHEAAGGKPWIWRAEFFDHRPETDLALLAKGYHLAFLDVGNTFGCPNAMAHWNAFYKELTEKYGLSKKPALEGLSRGALYCFNWAAANPDQVGCIYSDNGVLDFKSWPAGKGKGKGSPDDWRKLIQDYHFASEADALAYAKNPIDNLAPLAKARVPLLLLCADADDVVPYLENGAVAKARYDKLRGTAIVMIKHGLGHHPHGLDDPTPIVNFIVEHCSQPNPR